MSNKKQSRSTLPSWWTRTDSKAAWLLFGLFVALCIIVAIATPEGF
jgi:hypothetical protein